MIDKSIRYKYQWGGPGGKSPGTSSSGGSRGGGGPPGGGDRQMTYTAPSAREQAIARQAPVTTAVAPPSILSKPTVTTTPITRDVMPIVPTATKRPTEMLDIAGDIKSQQKLQEDIQESQRTGAYAKELGLPSIRRDVMPTPIINPFEETEKAGKLVDLTDLRDDAKTRQVQILQKQADLSWQNKTTREKEEQQEKWDAAESKIKLQKEGGFWKSLGNIAMAMILPALLPAELVRGYNLYKTAKSATALWNKLGGSDTTAAQYVKKMIGGKDLSSLIAGDQNVIAKNMATFSGQTDTSKEYTEDTIGKVQTAADVEPVGQITNEERQKYISDLEKAQGILQQGYYIDNQGRQIPLTENMRRQLSDYMNHLDRSLDPYRIPEAAHGGRIDSPLMGGSRYI